MNELIAALVALRERFDLAQVSASNVTLDGVLVAVSIYREFGTISDEVGHVQAFDLPELAA